MLVMMMRVWTWGDRRATTTTLHPFPFHLPSGLGPLPYFFPSIHPFVLLLLPNNFFFLLSLPTFVLFMEGQLGFGMNTIGNGPADKTGRHWRCRRK
jgi:hypothetical protein